MAGRAGKPIPRVPAFWDASALVPLCVRQGITPQAIALYKTHDAVVWGGHRLRSRAPWPGFAEEATRLPRLG